MSIALRVILEELVEAIAVLSEPLADDAEDAYRRGARDAYGIVLNILRAELEDKKNPAPLPGAG